MADVQTTYADVITMCRLALADILAPYTWNDDQLTLWIKEAIRDYGAHFQRVGEMTKVLAAGEHEYDLLYDVLEILLVEYPPGEDPPEYLERFSRKDPSFWLSDAYYDFEPSHQEYSIAALTSVPPRLYLSPEPEALQTAYILYNGSFEHAAAVLVPKQHLPILIAYVQWRAAANRLFEELKHPDYSNPTIGTMRNAVEALRTIYDRALRLAKEAQSRSRWTRPWRSDGYDPVY